MNKINVKQIDITQLEGLIVDCDKTYSYDNLNDANNKLMEISRKTPKGGCYNKTRVTVIFEDDTEYTGRWDVKHFSERNADNKVMQHIKDHFYYYAALSDYGKECYLKGWITDNQRKEANEWLEKYNLSEVQTKMETEKNYEIEDKTFKKVTGKINPDSLFLRLAENELSYEVEAGKERHWYKTNEKAIVSKTLSLFGLNRKELLKQMKENKTNESEIVNFVRDTVKDKNRELVFLIDENTDLHNVVTKRHKQLPLKDIFDTVKEVATASGFQIEKITENKNSYQVHLKTGEKTDLMESKIDVHLGRNDSRGRAGIHIQGNGSIFVCSNMIVANAGRDVTTNAKKLGIDMPEVVKLIHTTNIGQRFKEQVKAQMIAAKDAAILLGTKLKESQSIQMLRSEQEKTIDLICEKFNLGNKWNKTLKRQLFFENQKEPEFNETLYQLSQAITYIGTHHQIGSENVRNQLCKIGGQVVLLGKDFVTLMKDLVEKKKEQPIEVKATSF